MYTLILAIDTLVFVFKMFVFYTLGKGSPELVDTLLVWVDTVAVQLIPPVKLFVIQGYTGSGHVRLTSVSEVQTE